MIFIIVLFIVLVGGGWLIGKLVGNCLFPDKDDKYTFIDKSVHHHNHIHIIDDKSKKDIATYHEQKQLKK